MEWFEAEQQRDEDGFREDSRTLELYRTRDYSPLDAVFATLFKRSENRPPQRTVPLVYRLSHDQAPQYVRRPIRRIDAPVGTQRRIEEMLGLPWHRAMRTASRRAVTHQSVIASIDPKGPLSAELRSWCPYECNVVFRDPYEEDIRNAERVEIRVPLSKVGDVVTYGMRVYTQDLAVVTDATGKKELGEIFPGTNGLNPYDGIPLAAMRLAEAEAGFYFPALRWDWKHAQEGVCAVLSFSEHIMRVQGFTRTLLTGGEAAQAIENKEFGPNAVEAWPGDGISVDFVTPNPPVDRTLAALETTLRLFGSSNLVQVESLLSHSTGITGDAKAMERLDQEEARRELELDLEQFESDAINLLTEVVGPYGIPRRRERLKVELDYQYPEPPRNELQQMQAFEAASRLGLDSSVRKIAREQGISLEQAAATLTAIVSEQGMVLRELLAAGLATEAAPPTQGDNNLPGSGPAPSSRVPEIAGPDAESTDDKVAVQDPQQSLNGAQVASMVEIAKAVEAGELSEEQAQRILEFSFGMDLETARRIAAGA